MYIKVIKCQEVVDDEYEVYEVKSVLGPPYFITVHQLVEVMERDTAVLECAVTNIDTAVTVSGGSSVTRTFIHNMHLGTT